MGSHYIVDNPPNSVHVNRPTNMHTIAKENDADFLVWIDPKRCARKTRMTVTVFGKEIARRGKLFIPQLPTKTSVEIKRFGKVLSALP
jgi:hypothetical protein